jgi:hypothetical protein
VYKKFPRIALQPWELRRNDREIVPNRALLVYSPFRGIPKVSYRALLVIIPIIPPPL